MRYPQRQPQYFLFYILNCTAEILDEVYKADRSIELFIRFEVVDYYYNYGTVSAEGPIQGR